MDIEERIRKRNELYDKYKYIKNASEFLKELESKGIVRFDALNNGIMTAKKVLIVNRKMNKIYHICDDLETRCDNYTEMITLKAISESVELEIGKILIGVYCYKFAKCHKCSTVYFIYLLD